VTGRRVVATAVLTCALCAGGAGAAGGARAATGVVSVSGILPAPQEVALAALPTEVSSLPVAGSDGRVQDVPTAGHSVRQVLASIPIQRTDFTFADVLRTPSDDLPVRLAAGDAWATGPGPVVWGDAQGTHFLAPDGDGRFDAADEITVPDGPLRLDLEGNPEPDVRTRPHALRTTVGRTVTFAATAVGFPEGARLTYRWTVGGKKTIGTGRSVTYRFARASATPYGVLVTVSDDRGHTDYDTVSVTVAAAQAAPRAHERKAADGGAASGDGAGGDAAGGARTGGAGGAGGGTGGTGAGGSTGDGDGATAGAGDDGASAAAAAVHHAAHPPAPKPAEPKPAAPQPTHPAPASVPRAAPPLPVAHGAAPGTTTRTVSGDLLTVPPDSEVVALPAAAPPAAATPASAGAADRHDGGGVAIPPVVWELALVVLLVAAGWWLDRRDERVFPSLPWNPS